MTRAATAVHVRFLRGAAAAIALAAVIPFVASTPSQAVVAGSESGAVSATIEPAAAVSPTTAPPTTAPPTTVIATDSSSAATTPPPTTIIATDSSSASTADAGSSDTAVLGVKQGSLPATGAGWTTQLALSLALLVVGALLMAASSRLGRASRQH